MRRWAGEVPTTLYRHAVKMKKGDRGESERMRIGPSLGSRSGLIEIDNATKTK